MAKILLVDDEPDIIFTTKKILEKEGHEVITASNTKECLKTAKKERPDLILLDIMMPGEDGWEASRKIKKDRKIKKTPVVMFTVRSSEEDIIKSMEYSLADNHINKPFKKEELLEIINRHLKGKQ